MRSVRLIPILTALFAMTLTTPSDVLGQGASSGPIDLQYQFKEGGSLRYSMSFRYNIQEYDRSETPQWTGGTVYQSYVYRQEVQNVKPETGLATLRLTFAEVKFHGGNEEEEAFDSAKIEHRRNAKAKGHWRPWGAVLSSTASIRLNRQGEVSFWRVVDMDRDYQGMEALVQPVIAEVVSHAIVVLPTEHPDPSVPWIRRFPIKFVGGVLSGQTVHVLAKFTLLGVTTTDAERVARFGVSLAEPPALPIGEGSARGITVDFTAPRFEGSLVFSLTRGHIVSFALTSHTVFKLSARGQLAREHRMTRELSLSRLAR